MKEIIARWGSKKLGAFIAVETYLFQADQYDFATYVAIAYFVMQGAVDVAERVMELIKKG